MKIRSAVLAACAATAVGVPLSAPAHAATGWVAVVVTINPSAAASNAAVNLWNVDTGARYKIKESSSAGNYALWTSEVPAGRYTVTATGAGDAATWPTQWWPGAFSSAAAGIVTLQPASTTNNCAANPSNCNYLTWSPTLVNRQAVSGWVKNRSNADVAGATVTVTRVGEPSTRFTTVTSGDGRYSLSVPTGTYDFSVPVGNTVHSERREVKKAETVNMTLPAAPTEPRELEVLPSSKQIVVRWKGSWDDGGLGVREYRATATPGGQSCSTDKTECTITGLANNTTYRVSVVASNAVGTSPAATSGQVTLLDPKPAAPTGVRAVAASRKATVSWNPPVSEGVTGYRVVSSPGGYTCTTTQLTCEVTGLTNGQSYTFRVIASSTGGDSEMSEASSPVVPAGIPEAPREVRAVAGTRSVKVSWLAPRDDGGASVSQYTATASPGGRQCTVDSTTRECTIEDLTRRAYTVTVTATNRVGTSEGSAPSNEVTPLDPAPETPRAVQAVASTRAATVSWSPPRTGADTVTGYRVVSSPGGYTCTTTDLTCEVTGLTNGQSYTFRVIASSTGGDSEMSEASAPVTPAGAPSAPRSVQADASDRSVLVTWGAPLDDGGSPITTYTATAWPGGRVCSTTAEARQCGIGGLTNGQSYTVTVTATNRIGVSERSPGSVQVTPEDSGGSATAAAPRVSLFKTAAGKGRVTVRWKIAGAQRVKLSWQRVGGKRHSKATASKTGRMVLKGKRGTKYRVAVTGYSPTGPKASRTKVFTIAR